MYRGNNPLRKIEITVDKVKMKLKKLNSNKSAGPDGFYPRVIKETEEETAPHFCNIFRTSLEQRKAVRDWKLQNISPLFKKGSKDDPGNYRPISLTSVPGKMLESIIADDMMSHLEHNKLILDSQHGFRSGRSCLTNLVDFFHDMFSIYDKSRAVDIVWNSPMRELIGSVMVSSLLLPTFGTLSLPLYFRLPLTFLPSKGRSITTLGARWHDFFFYHTF